jgi:methylated-DNA-[protein]-cysteine S-methyltransferase
LFFRYGEKEIAGLKARDAALGGAIDKIGMRDYAPGEKAMDYFCKIPSPLGTLTAASNGEAITGLWIEGQKYFALTLDKGAAEQNAPPFEQLHAWLDRYFSGKEPDFMPPLMPRGSAFQQSVWDLLRKVPYGQTTTYGTLAKQHGERSGGKSSPRAIGGAVGHNPISILIPCHRVVGADGSLTGYAGGVDKKIWLLRLEGIVDRSKGDIR